MWEAANRDDLFSVTSLKHLPVRRQQRLPQAEAPLFVEDAAAMREELAGDRAGAARQRRRRADAVPQGGLERRHRSGPAHQCAARRLAAPAARGRARLTAFPGRARPSRWRHGAHGGIRHGGTEHTETFLCPVTRGPRVTRLRRPRRISVFSAAPWRDSSAARSTTARVMVYTRQTGGSHERAANDA